MHRSQGTLTRTSDSELIVSLLTSLILVNSSTNPVDTPAGNPRVPYDSFTSPLPHPGVTESCEYSFVSLLPPPPILLPLPSRGSYKAHADHSAPEQRLSRCPHRRGGPVLPSFSSLPILGTRQATSLLLLPSEPHSRLFLPTGSASLLALTRPLPRGSIVPECLD